jgi:hypothetical protein
MPSRLFQYHLLYVFHTVLSLTELDSVELQDYFRLYIVRDRLCGLVVRVPGYRTEMYCVSCEVRTEFMYFTYKKVNRLYGLVVRVPDYTTEIYCTSCEVRTEFIYVT